MNLFNAKGKGGVQMSPPKPKIVGRQDVARRYAAYPSFADLMPWLEWSDEDDIVVLEDGRSVGAVFDIKAVPSEARPEAQISALHEKLVRLLSGILPLEDENPWVMQIFVQDDLTLQPVYKSLERYIAKNNSLDDPLAQKYLAVMDGHLKAMCEGDGLFTDPLSNLPFRGKIRRIRVTVYRRYSKLSKNTKMPDVIDEIKTVCRKFESQMRQAGIKVSRLKAERFYDWLVRWFNPKPQKASSVDALLKRFPYPGTKKPYGWSFSQNVFFGDIESTDDGWLFDGVKHKVLTFRDLDSEIPIGAVSREMSLGDSQKYAILDKFPPGAIYTIQITFESKAALETHLTAIEKAAIGKSGVIKDIRRNVDRARIEIDNKNMLFRCVEAVYFSAQTDEEMKMIETDLDSLLSEIQISIVETNKEIFPKDLYLRFLPFAFDYEFDKKHSFRSSYKFADDIARLLPVYGRSQGDGMNPLLLYFNRGGEPFMFDHLNPNTKQLNSHMAIVGGTGSGKSVQLNGLIGAISAVYNPRIFALEVGGSFDLTAQFLAQNGRSVKTMKFEKSAPIIVNPYAEWERALTFTKAEEANLQRLAIESAGGYTASINEDGIKEEMMAQSAMRIEHELEAASKLASDKELEAEEERDYLGEMLLATRTMITGGKAEEEQGITRSDDMLISRCLIQTMKRCEAAKVPQMVAQHVHETFNIMAQEERNPEIGKRLAHFALNIENYLTGIRAHFINGPSEALADADLTHIDFGFLQSEDYKDLMNVVCISLLAKILAVAEKNKASGRSTILIIDEAHVFFKSKMVAAFIILMSKVARKVGLWIIPCTQNINDFSGVESRKVLSMMETWLCLSLDRQEIALVDTFKPLTDEMKALMLDVQKYPGIYSEGVLLAKREGMSGLFRYIPPRLTLALAMTEQTERAARKKVQLEKGISELEAVEEIAKSITAKKQERSDDQFFLY